jgi:arabinofuranan 3-O-arabinosyltransferase
LSQRRPGPAPAKSLVGISVAAGGAKAPIGLVSGGGRAVLAWSRLRWDWTLPLRAGLAALAMWIWWRALEHWRSLYGFALRQRPLGFDIKPVWLAEHAWLSGRSPYHVFNFLYPPSHLMVMLPLAAFSEKTVEHYADVAVVIALAAAVMMSAKLIGRRYWGLTAAIGFFVISVAQPVHDEMILENVSVLIATGLCATLLLASKDHWNWAAGALGITLAVKPILAPVVLLFVFARRWKALYIAIGIPFVLNLAALPTIRGLGRIWSILPLLFDRTGTFDAYNASLFSVGALTGLPSLATTVVRVAAAILALLAAWWGWRFSYDDASRLVNTSAALLIGLYLAGPLTEDHYMLTLIPLAIAASTWRSPASLPTAWLGLAWLMNATNIWGISTHLVSGSTLGITEQKALMVDRCLGLALVLLTLLAGIRAQRALTAYAMGKSTRPNRWLDAVATLFARVSGGSPLPQRASVTTPVSEI